MAFSWQNFVFKTTFQCCCLRALVRAGGKGILLFAADAVQFTQHFGCQTHHTSGFGDVFRHARVEIHAVRHRYVTHVFNTADDTHFRITHHDRTRSVMQRLHG